MWCSRPGCTCRRDACTTRDAGQGANGVLRASGRLGVPARACHAKRGTGAAMISTNDAPPSDHSSEYFPASSGSTCRSVQGTVPIFAASPQLTGSRVDGCNRAAGRPHQHRGVPSTNVHLDPQPQNVFDRDAPGKRQVQIASARALRNKGTVTLGDHGQNCGHTGNDRASRSVDISTKPKPLERPVSLSVIILTLSTRPQAVKASCNSGSVVSNGRLPT